MRLLLPILLAICSVASGQDTATGLIQSKLIEAPDSVAEGKLISILLPPDLPFKIDPQPTNKLSFIDEETGKRAYLILEAKPPGYTISIDYAVIHPTDEELAKAPTVPDPKDDAQVKLFKEYFKGLRKDEIYKESKTVTVGKGPDPGPDPGPTPDPPSPAPIPEAGFRVMFLIEKGTNLPPLQRAIIAGREVDEYLRKTCITEPSGQAAWRVFDQNQDLTDELPIWQKAMENSKPESLPWVLISNGKTGIQCKLPDSPSAFIELCKKYEVK